MYSLIDKLQPVTVEANIPTVGYQGILVQVTTSNDDYEGTKAEADAIVEGMTVKVAEDTAADGTDLEGQYIKARTIAGTKIAFVEIVLTQAYVKTLTFAGDLTVNAKLYTNPAI